MNDKQNKILTSILDRCNNLFEARDKSVIAAWKEARGE